MNTQEREAADAIIERLAAVKAQYDAYAWPALTVTIVDRDEDGAPIDGLLCPWCGVALMPGGGLHAVEHAERWSYVRESTDYSLEQIDLSNDDRGDFETKYFTHDRCDKPVRLPEGWTENWS